MWIYMDFHVTKYGILQMSISVSVGLLRFWRISLCPNCITWYGMITVYFAA